MSNVPKLRFREFKGEWQERTLSQLATFYNSKRVPLTESDRIKGPYPYYGASGIIDYVEDYLFDGTYILLGEDGANIVLRNSRLVYLAHGKFWVNNHAHVFQAKESNEFLCEALERLNYTKYNTGTAQPKLNSDVVKKVKVSTPHLEEQQKIATFLTAVDTKIEQLTQIETLLKQYKKGVMQKIFSQEIRFKADDGSEFPEWNEVALGELGKASMCKRILKEQTSVTGAVPFFKIGTFGGEPDAFISQELFDEYRNKYGYPKVGDILISASGTIGRTVIFDGKPAYFQDSNIVWIDNQEHIVSNAFLYFAYKMVTWTTQDTTIARLYNDTLRSIRIRTPSSLTEQGKVVGFLQSVDQKIQQVSDQLRSAKTFKKGLLQQMFV